MSTNYTNSINSNFKSVKTEIEQLKSGSLQNKADVDLSNISTTAKKLITDMSAPSDTYVNLTVGASGTSYTAPANGYYLAVGLTNNENAQHIIHFDKNDIMWTEVTTPYQNNTIGCFCPVRKNEAVKLHYGRMTSFTYFRFYYAQGAV